MPRSFELILVNHCAPMLCGIKPATLLLGRTMPNICAWDRLHQKGIRMLKLFRKSGTELLFLYNPALLQKTLSHKTARERLVGLGYPPRGNWREWLAHLRKRMAQNEEFPHEIGFFLGYPPEDVIGFMDCEDRCNHCCKTSGLWKVFGDQEQAQKLFCDYERCKQALLSHMKRHGCLWTAELTVAAV